MAKLLLYFNYYISLGFQEELTYSLKQNHTEKILVTFTVKLAITYLLLLLLLSHFSCVWLCATPWTAAHQVPCPQDSLGKNAEVGCHFLLYYTDHIIPICIYNCLLLYPLFIPLDQQAPHLVRVLLLEKTKCSLLKGLDDL